MELYGYLTLLKVKALGPNKIELSLAGQTATLVQTSPYVFQRVEANGDILKYHFGKVYFEVANGKVQRMSGDFLPLPRGRTMPWLITSLVIVIVSAIYFITAPIVLLIGKLRKMRKKNEDIKTFRDKKVHRIFTLLVLSGTATLINNAVLIARMLMNNYRSFYEIRPHILLNYPLVIVAAILIISLLINWRSAGLSKRQKALYLVTIGVMTAFICTLISWQFLNVIA